MEIVSVAIKVRERSKDTVPKDRLSIDAGGIVYLVATLNRKWLCNPIGRVRGLGIFFVVTFLHKTPCLSGKRQEISQDEAA